MIALISRKLRLRKLRAFGRREDGAAAVEFAIVALPFLAMLFAILETALVFFAGQTLETAVADSGRLIMTGQAQTTTGYTETSFRNAVCAKLAGGLFNCASSDMTVDVKKYTAFSDADLSRPVNDDGTVKSGGYDPGCPGDIVVVRLIYQYPVYVSLMGLADMSGNKRLLVATSVFRNEPYKATC